MRSLVVVVTPPILDVMPANVTVEAGASLTLTCRDENDLARRTVNGTYHWYRDGRLLTSASASASASARRFSSCREMVEDLFPVGSLLKIANVQVRFLPLGFLSFSLSLSVCLSFFRSFVRVLLETTGCSGRFGWSILVLCLPKSLWGVYRVLPSFPRCS